jgi:hypothetical protein
VFRLCIAGDESHFVLCRKESFRRSIDQTSGLYVPSLSPNEDIGVKQHSYQKISAKAVCVKTCRASVPFSQPLDKDRRKIIFFLRFISSPLGVEKFI